MLLFSAACFPFPDAFLVAFFSLGEYLENKCNQNYMGVDFSLPLVNFKAYGHVFQVLLVGNGGGLGR